MGRGNIHRALLCIFFLTFFFLLLLSAYASDSEKVIRAIEVKGLTRIDEEELRDLICFDTGDILNRHDLGRGIKRAFKKGIFYDIQAESEPYDGGIKLTFIVKEIPVVNDIVVTGNESFSGRQIKKSILLKKGQNFKEEFLHGIKHTLLEFYRRKGFPEAKIRILAEDTEKTASVDIRIHIVEGQPVRIKKMSVPADVRYLVTLSEGDIYDLDEIDKNIKRLKDHLRKKNYISPEVGPSWFANGELTIPVQKGPQLKVIFKNNTAVRTRKLRKEVLFMESGEVTDELVSEAVNRIERLYASKGYYYARITAAVERKAESIRVTFGIAEGEQVVLKKVAFTGISVKPETVKKVVPLKENKPFNKNLLGSSEEALVRFYNALGYLQMEVVEIKKEFQNDGREVAVEIVVNEGQQTKIASIEITGNRKVSSSQIREILKLYEGLPYNIIDVGDARHRVLSFYANQGHLNARVVVKRAIDEHKAHLTFDITENKPSVIGKIVLHGNNKTKAKIIKREFTFEEGETYNREEITNVKQRLYKLGLFNEVLIDIMEPDEEGESEIVRDMVVSLKEGNAGSVEIGVGFGDYERLRGSFDISYRNLGGYHREIGFRTELSSIEERYIFNFKEPWFLNRPDVPLKLFLLKEDTRSIDIETRDVLYKIDRLSFIAGIEKELAKGLKAGLGYEYSFVDTKDVEPGVILSKEDTGTIGISSVSPSLFYDTRDDPFDPASGMYQQIVVKYASKLFLSETEFIKGSFQSSWFFPLMKRLVFAFSLRGGAAYGFEETEEIPLIERFFLGGRTTVRGYDHDTLGPKGEDDRPTGGNIFALTNGELRFSVWRGLGLVTFVDAGNVWQTFDDVEAQLKYTAGAGLRYRTPVGPLRIDYGHKMNRDPGESTGEVHFSFGHAF